MKHNFHTNKVVRQIRIVFSFLIFAFTSFAFTSNGSTVVSQAKIDGCQIAQKDPDLSDEEKIKEVIDNYFKLDYEGQKTLKLQDFSSLIEDSSLKWVKMKKEGRELQIYILTLYNTPIASYKYTLDYDSILIDNKKAIVQLRESNEIVTTPDFIISEMGNRQHVFTLHERKGVWLIYKDEHYDEFVDSLKHNTQKELLEQTNENYQKDLASVTESTVAPQFSNTFYSGVRAKAYTDLYYNTSSPPNYTAYPENDCTNFVSQAVYAGMYKVAPDTSGMTTFSNRNEYTDWYYDYNTQTSSAPWNNVSSQFTFITTNTTNIASTTKMGTYGTWTSNACSIRVGDIVQLAYPGTTNYFHEGLVVAKSYPCLGAQSVFVAAHTTNYKSRQLSLWSPNIMRFILIQGINKYTFTDVPPTYWAWENIERLYNSSITAGCGGGNYCPDNTVTRAEMAIFLLKGIHGSTYTPPPVGSGTGFHDVPISYWAAAWIKQLASENITAGCGGGNYCPEGTTTHAQMAIFLLRSKYHSAYNPPAVGSSTGFDDVPTTYWAASWIKQVNIEGISYGAEACATNLFCPEYNVTRAEMAGMLVRAFSLP